jgi:glycosyltransferase involved in cell wall biosynthesis
MHNVTVVAFEYCEDSKIYLKQYCDEIVTVTRFKPHGIRLVDYFINYLFGLLTQDISFEKKNILDINFSWKMQKKIDKLIASEKFDIVLVDDPCMISYVLNVNLPKILTEVGNIPQVHLEAYKIEKSIFRKLQRLVLYLVAENYEKEYDKFDSCVTVTKQQKDILESHLSNLNISVIPFGVDIEHEYDGFDEEFPSILFFGVMSSVYNQRSAIYLCREIYPLIKAKIPDLKLYVVGRDPSEEILNLSDNESIIVAGYVEDLRPYLAHASVITLPIHGFGIKTRLLEAMAMGKAIVVSPEGTHGIDVTPEKDIIVADGPDEFALRVVELLNDEGLRKRIGVNARTLMEKKYSWEKIAEMINEACVGVLEYEEK